MTHSNQPRTIRGGSSQPILATSIITAAMQKSRPRWNVTEVFILSQTLLPALLYLPDTQAIRLPIRLASYGISLVFFAWYLVNRSRLQRRGPQHPAAIFLISAMGYLTLMLAWPQTNSLSAGVASIGFYLAILAPVFWVPSFVEGPERLTRLLWLILLCSGCNAFVGVMQVLDPGRWMPAAFSAVTLSGNFGLALVSYQGADGTTIIRPPGLGDSPGAVAGPAVLAVFLGLAFAVEHGKWAWRIAAALCAILGATAIFFTLIRSQLLICIGMITVYGLLQVARGRRNVAGSLFVAAILIIAFAFTYAQTIGGASVISRFQSFFETDPLNFYYANRGNQVEAGFVELLPDYPLGAGLGRWGMINAYFGDPSRTDAPPIWVEIQWPAWIVDGGFVLLFLYPAALLVTIARQFKTAISARVDTKVSEMAALILPISAGLLLLCFSYPVFSSPSGLQFWFLAGALFNISGESSRHRVSRLYRSQRAGGRGVATGWNSDDKMTGQ